MRDERRVREMERDERAENVERDERSERVRAVNATGEKRSNTYGVVPKVGQIKYGNNARTGNQQTWKLFSKDNMESAR